MIKRVLISPSEPLILSGCFHCVRRGFVNEKSNKGKLKKVEGNLDITTESGRTFQQMGVSSDRLITLEKNDLIKMFPIQEKTFRKIRDGEDVIGRAKTGTGKTLAYLLPIIERYESRCSGAPNAPFIMILGT